MSIDASGGFKMDKSDKELIKLNVCPKCFAPLVGLMSLNKKKCPDCQGEYPWPLDENQPPLIKAQR